MHTLRRLARRAAGPLLAGLLLLSAVGSCELPKPKIPSIGAAPAGPGPVTLAAGMRT